jgi:hypothetical protein
MARGAWPDRSWHPLLATVEPKAGVWEMHDGTGRVYGLIRIIRMGEEVGYKAEYVNRDGFRDLVGYRTNLAAACLHVHWRFISDHAPRGGVNGS